MIRCRAQSDKHKDCPCFTCDQPLIPFSVYPTLFLLAPPSPASPLMGLYSSVCFCTHSNPVWDLPCFTILSVLKSRLMFLETAYSFLIGHQLV